MTVRSIEMQFLTCDCCGELGPSVEDSDRGTWRDGLLAQNAARAAGWKVTGDGHDWCPACVIKDAELTAAGQ